MVIQRWQSVLLLVAGLMMGLASFCTLAQISAENFTYFFRAYGFNAIGEATAQQPAPVYTWMLLIITAVSAICPLIAIFLYKSLRLQMKFTLMCIMLVIASAAVAVITAYQFASGASVDWTQTACAPLIALAAEIMAWNRMNADRRKLASATRII